MLGCPRVGLKVTTIFVEGPPERYEERSHVWIFYSGELSSLGIETIVCSDCLDEDFT